MIITPTIIFQERNCRERCRLRASFTLIELILAIGIVVALSVIVLLVLRPAELLRQARDGVRFSDLQTINKALLVFQVDQASGSFGNASTTYVSLPDPAATSTAGTNCAGIGLPTLPSGYVYHCAASSTLKNADGTGWIPVNFTLITFRSPISHLPVDPINATSSRNYYTYTPGGSWHLAASLESDRYKLGGSNDKVSKDGGSYTSLYEMGTNLTLLPVDYGDSSLMGYWKFDEGSGTNTYDASGRNHNGTLSGTIVPTWQSGGSCKSGNCLSFDTNYVQIPGVGFSAAGGGHTMMAWVKPNVLPVTTSTVFMSFSLPYLTITSPNSAPFHSININGGSQQNIQGNTTLSAGNWYHISGVYDNNTLFVYLNGVSDGSLSVPGSDTISVGSQLCVGAHQCATSYTINGIIDDVRVYNRALSAAEILALYNAIK